MSLKGGKKKTDSTERDVHRNNRDENLEGNEKARV